MTVMDSQWLRQCREGDPLAIERLVQAHQADVYRLAFSILDDPDEADDATQEVFVAALRSLDSFRGDSSLKTWLFSITVNVCRSRLQRGRSRARLRQILQSLFRRDQAFPGSGSKYMIMSNRQVVFDNKPACHKMMHVFHFRKRQGLANISGESLS
jgi:RNA polymerase sigma factor (sigma-70 family)